MLLFEVLSIAAGAVAVFLVLAAAVRTVVVPRSEEVLLNRIVFRVVREAFELFARPSRPYLARDRVMARYAPTALMMLPVVWAVAIIGGFSLMFWGLGERPYRHALVLAGSSVTTLGFDKASTLAPQLLSVAEALIGLGLVALLISFLPTMYGHFSRREVMVTQLHNWASDREGVALPTTMLIRAHLINGLDRLPETWSEWERWFVELEETHTSFPALALFRSPDPQRSWVSMAGVVLDAAALYDSCVMVDTDASASLMLRAGFLSLRHVADNFDIQYTSDPQADDPISITKDEFLAAYDELAAAGLPLYDDKDEAWRDFAGWRVNYDETITALASLLITPDQPWVSDRSVIFRRAPVFRRGSS